MIFAGSISNLSRSSYSNYIIMSWPSKTNHIDICFNENPIKLSNMVSFDVLERKKKPHYNLCSCIILLF